MLRLRIRVVMALAASACTPTAGPDETPARPPAEALAPGPEPPKPSAGPPAKPGVPCTDAPFPETGPPPDDGATMSKTAKPRTFGAITCAGDREVWRRPSGELQVCTIAKPTRAHGIALAGDNYTHFHKNGAPYQTTLGKPHTLVTRAGTSIACAADFAVLDDAGKVEHCTLARETTLGKVQCRAGDSVAFGSKGTLTACTIAAAVTVLDHSFPAGTSMSWHDGGEAAGVYVADEIDLAGWRVQSQIDLHPNGQLAHFTLAEDRTIGGLVLAPFAKVWLFANGSPWHVEYVADRGFMVHGEPWTDTRRVTFDCAGTIVRDTTEHYQAPTSPRSRHD